MQQLLRCTCGGCRLVWAKSYNGILLADSTHRGRRHTNGIALSILHTIMRAGIDRVDLRSIQAQPLVVERRSVMIEGVETPVLALMCHQVECGLPWAYITNDTVFIDSEHGNQRHTNRLYMNGVVALLPGPLDALFLK